jgi:hypothetical protein
MGKINYAELLYSQPSMLEGLARVLDVGGVFDAYNESPTSGEADQIAMMSDWYAVSSDLHHAVQRYSETAGEELAGDANARSH